MIRPGKLRGERSVRRLGCPIANRASPILCHEVMPVSTLRLPSIASRLRNGFVLASLVAGMFLVGGGAQARGPAEVANAATASSTFSAGIQIQNLSSTTANVTVAYYNPDGSQPSTPSQSLTIPGNSSTTL